MWWYLLLILPALLVLILITPVYLAVKLDNATPQIKVKFGLIDITRFVLREEKDDVKQSKKKVVKTKTAAKKHKKQSLTEKINLFKDTVSIAWQAVKAISKRVTVTRFCVNCRVSSDDAAQTAIVYGAACAAMSALEAFVNENFKVKKQNIYIYPDFTQFKSHIYAEIRIRMFVFSVIGAGISIIFNIIRKKQD